LEELEDRMRVVAAGKAKWKSPRFDLFYRDRRNSGFGPRLPGAPACIEFDARGNTSV